MVDHFLAETCSERRNSLTLNCRNFFVFSPIMFVGYLGKVIRCTILFQQLDGRGNGYLLRKDIEAVESPHAA